MKENKILGEIIFSGLEFFYLGYLDELSLKKTPNADFGGVYLWIYNANPPYPKRIIYVGTASNSILKRNQIERNQLKHGFGTLFRPKHGDDLYDIMCIPNTISDSFYNYYHDRLDEIWIPNERNKSDFKGFCKDIYGNDNFLDKWKDYILTYLSKIMIFFCRVEFKDRAEFLETQLQQAISNYLIKNESKIIGYYSNDIPQNWLGKQEKRDDKEMLRKLRFDFVNQLPISDDILVKEVLENTHRYLD